MIKRLLSEEYALYLEDCQGLAELLYLKRFIDT